MIKNLIMDDSCTFSFRLTLEIEQRWQYTHDDQLTDKITARTGPMQKIERHSTEDAGGRRLG